MTLNVGERLIVDYVVKLDLETTCRSAGSSDILGVLTAADEEMELLVLLGVVERAHAARSDRDFALNASNLVEGLRMQKLARAITAASVKHAEVGCEMHREDLGTMHIAHINDLAGLNVVLDQSAAVRAVEDGLVKGTPLEARNEMILGRLNSLNVLQGALLATTEREHVLGGKDAAEGLVAVIRVGYAEVLITERQLNLVGNDTGHWDFDQHVTICRVENLYALSGRRGEQELRVLRNIDRLARVTDLEEADSLHHDGVVHAHGLVIGA